MPVRCETPFSSAAAAEKGGIPSKNMFGIKGPGIALNPEGGYPSRQGRSSDSPLPHAFPSRGTVAKECAERNGAYSYGNSP